jgi:hypothetical protein
MDLIDAPHAVLADDRPGHRIFRNCRFSTFHYFLENLRQQE